LEEQQEKLEGDKFSGFISIQTHACTDLMKQQEAAWHPHARSKQAKDFRESWHGSGNSILVPADFGPTGPPPFQHSSSSGSPNESVLREYMSHDV
jgi:hypothetical protein